MQVSDELRPEERDILRKVSGLPIDYASLAVVSNIWRTAAAVKNQMERTILREYELSWSGFSTLFIAWVWGPVETRDIARLQGVTRPTISSNVSLLEGRRLCKRRIGKADKRLITVELTARGRVLIEELFPRFNQHERAIASTLNTAEQATIAQLLRKVVAGINELSDVSGAPLDKIP